MTSILWIFYWIIIFLTSTVTLLPQIISKYIITTCIHFLRNNNIIQPHFVFLYFFFLFNFNILFLYSVVSRKLASLYILNSGKNPNRCAVISIPFRMVYSSFIIIINTIVSLVLRAYVFILSSCYYYVCHFY